MDVIRQKTCKICDNVMNFLNRTKNATKQALIPLDYQITYEPLPPESLKQLPEPVQERVKELYHLAQTQPLQAVSPLLDMIDKYPNLPVCYNYLRLAYERTGQVEKSDALLEVIYRKFPDYLFAKTNYAFRCLRNRSLEKIPEIFNRKFDLNLLYSQRLVFHISEFTAFTCVMALYHFLIGDRQNALKHYALLKQWAPNHELTQLVKSQLDPTLLEKLLDQLGIAFAKIVETMERLLQNKIEALEETETTTSPKQAPFYKTF